MSRYAYHRVRQKISQQGLALPTVLALFMVSGVLLLASWRNIALAQGWSRHHADQWQWRQVALGALQAFADTALHPTLANAVDATQPLHIPTTTEAWASVRSQLPDSGCDHGVCRSLLDEGNLRSDWLGRTHGAYTLSDPGGLQLFHWVEILPNNLSVADTAIPFTYRITVVAVDPKRNAQTGWQAVWQPAASISADKSVRLADMQRLLELLP